MPALTQDDLLSNIYYDLERGYGSANSLYSQAKEQDETITLEEVRKWLRQQPNKQRKGYRGFNSYVANFPRDEYQIDIADMKYYKENPRYVLVVIDVFSKYAEVEAMVSKDSNAVYDALVNIFRVM